MANQGTAAARTISGLTAKARKAALLLTRPAWVLAAARGVAATTEHRELARLLSPTTVVDVGANKGQFTVFALGSWPSCCVIGFEPLGGPITRARAATARYRDRVRLQRAAIGPASGEVDVRLASRQDSSSILPITEAANDVFGVTATGTVERAQVGPLAAFVLPEELRPPVLLKLDVQGYELEALRGCASLLPRIAAIYVEQSFIRLYEGQALAEEVATFLQHAGFRQKAELNIVIRPGLGKIQSDCLFTRVSQ